MDGPGAIGALNQPEAPTFAADGVVQVAGLGDGYGGSVSLLRRGEGRQVDEQEKVFPGTEPAFETLDNCPSVFATYIIKLGS